MCRRELENCAVALVCGRLQEGYARLCRKLVSWDGGGEVVQLGVCFFFFPKVILLLQNISHINPSSLLLDFKDCETLQLQSRRQKAQPNLPTEDFLSTRDERDETIISKKDIVGWRRE